jgi:hypothetical protein
MGLAVNFLGRDMLTSSSLESRNGWEVGDNVTDIKDDSAIVGFGVWDVKDDSAIAGSGVLDVEDDSAIVGFGVWDD